MKKPEDMKWIVHPFSYKDEGTEISVIHESDFHGLESYGWFSETKILIAKDTIYGNLHPEAKVLLRELARNICNKMNIEHSIPIESIAAAIAMKERQEESYKEIAKPIAEAFDKAVIDMLTRKAVRKFLE